MTDTIKKALECCYNFECDNCPYKKLDSQQYPIRCVHALIADIYTSLKEET